MRVPPETIRVLHVDDQPDFADLAATYLEREDDSLCVETATSAEAALERLDGTAVDCVVSDYEMPGRNGIEFLEAVREDNPDLPFILYTGKGSEEVASEAISAGVTDYLQKERGTGQYAVLANRIANAVDQYRAREEVTASRRRLSLFFEQSPLGVVEWDESFRVKRLNDAAREILGYAGDELVGESWERIVPGSDREQVDDVVSDLLAAEGGYHSVNENVRGDGERIVCEWHNRVVTDEDGDVVSIFSQFQDVTDRKAREQELARAKSRLETAIEAGDVATWEWHVPEDRLLTGPEFAETFGVDPDAAREGVPIDRFLTSMHEDDRDRVEERIRAALDECGAYEAEYRVWDADDDLRWVVARGHVECDDDGTPLRFPGALTDITDLKRAERELQRKNERLDEFARIVSHDLQNPLSVAEGRLELARAETDVPTSMTSVGPTSECGRSSTTCWRSPRRASRRTTSAPSSSPRSPGGAGGPSRRPRRRS